MSILSHNKAVLTDMRKRNDIFVEVNKSKEGQDFVEMSMKDADGKTMSAYITIKDLYSLTFSLVDADSQADMMPVRRTEMTTFKRRHIVATKKAMKKGEKIIVDCEINVPTIITEGMASVVGRKPVGKSEIITKL